MPRLEMRTGKHAGKTFTLSKAVILGRGDNVGIRVPDIKASREHCRVFIQGGTWVVVDLNSRNGITVNGRKTTRKELVSGDEIAIGETVLAYVDEMAVVEPRGSTPLPGEIVVDEIDLDDDGGGDASPAAVGRGADSARAASGGTAGRPTGKPSRRQSAREAAFAAARADAAGRARSPGGRGGGHGEDDATGLRVSDKVLQFSRVDASKASPFSLELSQYPVTVQIAIVGVGLILAGGAIWLIFEALGVTPG